MSPDTCEYRSIESYTEFEEAIENSYRKNFMKEVLHSLIEFLRYPEVDIADLELAFGIDSDEGFPKIQLSHESWDERIIVIFREEREKGEHYHIRYRTLDSKTITMTMTYTPLTDFEDGIYEFCEALFEAIEIRDNLEFH